MYSRNMNKKFRSQLQQSQSAESINNKYLHYFLDSNGNWVSERFHLVNTQVQKNNGIQHQITIPVDTVRFGMRVTIRWFNDTPNKCIIALVTGGKRQNGIVEVPFRVIESSQVDLPWAEMMPIACNRILNLRKEMKQ